MKENLPESLPDFEFHPDPVGNGAIASSDAVCSCCGRARGFVYLGPVYSKTPVAELCPWCIADGSACRRFDVDFVDGHFDDGRGYVALDAEWYFRVFACTPGVRTFNPLAWPVHCSEPAAFLCRREPYEMLFRCRSCATELVKLDLD